MNLLILGDVMGASGRKVLSDNELLVLKTKMHDDLARKYSIARIDDFRSSHGVSVSINFVTESLKMSSQVYKLGLRDIFSEQDIKRYRIRWWKRSMAGHGSTRKLEVDSSFQSQIQPSEQPPTSRCGFLLSRPVDLDEGQDANVASR